MRRPFSSPLVSPAPAPARGMEEILSGMSISVTSAFRAVGVSKMPICLNCTNRSSALTLITLTHLSARICDFRIHHDSRVRDVVLFVARRTFSAAQHPGRRHRHRRAACPNGRAAAQVRGVEDARPCRSAVRRFPARMCWPAGVKLVRLAALEPNPPIPPPPAPKPPAAAPPAPPEGAPRAPRPAVSAGERRVGAHEHAHQTLMGCMPLWKQLRRRLGHGLAHHRMGAENSCWRRGQHRRHLIGRPDGAGSGTSCQLGRLRRGLRGVRARGWRGLRRETGH